jgi:hypothetical protein
MNLTLLNVKTYPTGVVSLTYLLGEKEGILL